MRLVKGHCACGQHSLAEGMSQRWRAVGHAVSALTSLRFEPQTSSSRYERITAPPTCRCIADAKIIRVTRINVQQYMCSFDNSEDNFDNHRISA